MTQDETVGRILPSFSGGWLSDLQASIHTYIHASGVYSIPIILNPHMTVAVQSFVRFQQALLHRGASRPVLLDHVVMTPYCRYVSSSVEQMPHDTSRSKFKDAPVDSSIFKYIQSIGVGIPKRKITNRRNKKRRNNTSKSQFLSRKEEQEELRPIRRLASKTPPPPFVPAQSRKNDNHKTEEDNGIRRLPVKLIGSAATQDEFPRGSKGLAEVVREENVILCNIDNPTLTTTILLRLLLEDPMLENQPCSMHSSMETTIRNKINNNNKMMMMTNKSNNSFENNGGLLQGLPNYPKDSKQLHPPNQERPEVSISINFLRLLQKQLKKFPCSWWICQDMDSPMRRQIKWKDGRKQCKIMYCIEENH